MKNRKRISILLVLAMVMTMLTGFAAPAGASTPVSGVVIGHVPTVVSEGATTLASIRFAESGASIGNIRDNDQITVTLPSGVVFQEGLVLANVFVAGPGMETVSPAGVSFNAARTAATLTLNRAVYTDFAAAAFSVTLPVVVTAVGTGSINATVTTTTTAISGGTFAVGTFGTGAVTVDGTGTVGTVSRVGIGTQQGGITIRLRENAPNAFAGATADRIVLTLPEGVTWGVATYDVAGTAADAIRDVANERRLIVTRGDAAVGNANTFTIVNPLLNVTRLAALGDLTVTATGEGANAGRVTGSVVLARVADFGVDVRRPAAGATAVPAITAGRVGTDALNDMIEVREATAGSLIAGGTITLTLPVGVQFASTALAPTVTPATISSPVLSNGNRTATFSVASHVYARTVLFDFPANSILVSPTAAAGDVAVTVAGTAGATGTVNIATVRPAFTISAADTPTVALGVAAQSASDLVITEAAFGRITAGALELVLPAGVAFSGTPTVTRASGNIALGTAELFTTANNLNALRVTVNTASSVASVVYLSGIRLNVSRIAMDGPINVTVDGDAIVATPVAGAFPVAVAGNRPSVAIARVGVVAPPAPPAPPVTVFTIGALSFTRAGVTTAIDAAPSIVDGRTLLPLRFAALAVGVSEDNILWDPVRRTVTLLRGDRVVQLRIGDRNMTINGVVVPLEVPASIQNGRTVLPIRALAQALRASIAWDATARTVTVTAQ